MGWKEYKQTGKVTGGNKIATLGLLIVDDERGIVDSLAESFKGQMIVYPAYTPDEALEIFREKDIHVVLSDQRMPEMTGIEMFAKMKNINPMPIRILITGYSDINVVIRGVNEGLMWKYVTKPWDPEELKNVVIAGAKQYLKDSGHEELTLRLLGI
jgi:YesN/AraC family two-component response regulator